MTRLTSEQTERLMEIPQGLPTSPAQPIRSGNLRRILIVDPDPATARSLRDRLIEAGFSVDALHQVERACEVISSETPQLVVLDWDLPVVVTASLVKHIRGMDPHTVPRLIAVSAFSGEQHVVNSFEAGVDDYVVKPFSMRELIARVRVLLRAGNGAAASDLLQFGELQVDTGKERVTVRSRAVLLRGLEFRLLAFMVRNAERALPRELLLAHVWGGDRAPDPRAVDVAVQRLRKALALHGCDGYLQTVRSIGYRLSACAATRQL
jgi:two-component system phosphate regulon response regulator PhoB